MNVVQVICVGVVQQRKKYNQEKWKQGRQLSQPALLSYLEWSFAYAFDLRGYACKEDKAMRSFTGEFSLPTTGLSATLSS